MLVLTREVEQAIIINGNIEVKIVRVRGKKVRLGITAPPDVKVLREELVTCNETEDEV